MNNINKMIFFFLAAMMISSTASAAIASVNGDYITVRTLTDSGTLKILGAKCAFTKGDQLYIGTNRVTYTYDIKDIHRMYLIHTAGIPMVKGMLRGDYMLAAAGSRLTYVTLANPRVPKIHTRWDLDGSITSMTYINQIVSIKTSAGSTYKVLRFGTNTPSVGKVI